ncbi:hypothetical protein COOONC_13925 [Cooperia oncophora]
MPHHDEFSTFVATTVNFTFDSATGPGSYGQYGVQGRFVKKCTVNFNGYTVSIVACVTPRGVEIALGSHWTEDGKYYSCKDEGKGRFTLSWKVILEIEESVGK